MNTVEPIRDKKKINAMKKALKQGRDRLLFIFGINTGLRISDILSLRYGDVLDENGKPKDYVVVVEKKTKKTRIIALNDSIKKELRHVSGEPNDYLFKSQKGKNKPLTRVQAYRILNAAAARVGIKEPVGTHTLRKTFGYHAYKSNTDLSLIMDILNHSSQKETLRYIGIRRDEINNTYLSLNL